LRTLPRPRPRRSNRFLSFTRFRLFFSWTAHTGTGDERVVYPRHSFRPKNIQRSADPYHAISFFVSFRILPLVFSFTLRGSEQLVASNHLEEKGIGIGVRAWMDGYGMNLFVLRPKDAGIYNSGRSIHKNTFFFSFR
jgi:hypothetical protein